MKILGIDPGYAIVGYGVVDFISGRYRSLEHGAIITEAGEDFNHRLEIIFDRLTEIIKIHKPDCISIEKLYFQNNQKTAINVAEARGVCLLAAQKLGMKIFEYTPLQVKSALTGYGKAEKYQVMEMTKRLLNLKETPKPDDTADALALAITHGRCSSSIFPDAYKMSHGIDEKVPNNQLPPTKALIAEILAKEKRVYVKKPPQSGKQ